VGLCQPSQCSCLCARCKLRGHSIAYLSQHDATAYRRQNGSLFCGCCTKLEWRCWSAEGHSISVQPLPFKAVQLSKAFQTMIERDKAQSLRTWHANYSVARKLNIDGSALGRMTAACKVVAGAAVFDIGLSLRSGTTLCLPDMAQPSPDGALLPLPFAPYPQQSAVPS
jgi:hypothetical protein